MMFVGANAPLVAGPPVVTSQVASWWADDLVGIYADSAPVDSWTDRVGSHVASNTSTGRPTFDLSAADFAGQPAVDFNGTSHSLEVTGVTFTGGVGCVVVVASVDAVGSVLWCSSDIGSNTRYVQGVVFSQSSSPRLFVQQQNNDTSDSVWGSPALSLGTAYILEISTDGADWFMHVNNSPSVLTVSSGLNTGDWFDDTSGRDNFTIGVRHGSSNAFFLNGRIAYLGVADAQLSVGDRADLYGFLATHYGITI